MADQHEEQLSPTVTKVLDEFLTVLKADDDIDENTAERLDTLLRSGKAPKTDDLETALFPATKGNEA